MSRPAPAPENVDWEHEVQRRQVEWMQAVQAQDFEQLERILAAEFVLVSARFGFVDRERYLAIMRDYRIENFSYVEVRVTVHGDWGLAVSRYHEDATWRGRQMNRDFYLSDVWIFRDDRFQAVVRHSSIPVAHEEAAG